MFNLELIPVPQYVIKLLLLVGAAMLLHQITYRIFLPLFTKVSKKTRFTWDDYLIQRKVISRVFHLLPASVISLGIPVILDADTELFMILSKAVNIYYIVTGYSVFAALLNVVQDVFEENEISKRISIRGFVQAIKITVLLLSLILVISQIAGKSPLVFISGLGAFTAILMLVFKDSILGFVAGVQLTTMDLVRKGDWVEIPKHAADGDVIDLSLTTVRVRNWDKTITSIPAYELVSSSLKTGEE
ncbi:MAG TPA: mechanosensitive ion channel domain-containing protein [Chitinispirillaceae bacterium]|nr:mechanosensitive ion channel domain-containing protein [Chitinispirillaceae bacterium]